MNSDFNILKKKIENFRNKYLLFQFFRGVMFFILLFIFFYFILNLIEYKLFLPASYRRIVFLTAVLFFGLFGLRFIIFPLIQLTGWIKILDNRRITAIIKQSIPDVKDKLLNVIELNEMADDTYSGAITHAAISQKIDELKVFNFSDAISLQNLKTLGIYLIFSFIVIISIYRIDESFITGPGNRLLHYNQEFVKPAPFVYSIRNESLTVEKGENFTVQVECKGDEIPSVVYINIGGNNFVMKSAGKSTYEYELSSVLNSLNFYFTDLKYNSDIYMLDVVPIPVINNFETEIVPPSYTALPAHKIMNIGDIKIPVGSRVTWNFSCFDTDSLRIAVGEKNLVAGKTSTNQFIISDNFYSKEIYKIEVKNNRKDYETAMTFTVEIQEDMYPEIKVVQLPDSIKLTRFYFQGQIHDDYGFSNLLFHVNIDEEDSSFTIPVIPYLTSQEFYYIADFQDYNIPGKTINYYFSVTDNDQVNGPKTSTSGSYVFTFPDRKELEEKKEENFKNIQDLLSESRQLANELKKDLKDLQMKNMNSTISDWDKSQMVNDIVNRKNELEDLLNRIEKLNEEDMSFQNTFNEKNDDLQKKQEQIQDLLEDVMTDELRKLLEEFEKLAEEFSSKQLNDLSKKMDMTFEDLSKQLDRNMEMLKKMKIEQDLGEVVKRLEKVQERQEQGAENISESKDYEKQILKNEEDLRETQDIQQQLLGILEQNDALSKPLVFDDFKEEFEDIKRTMEESREELSGKNAKNSSRSMKSTSEKLKNLVFSMKQMLDSGEMEQNAEDIQNIKQILKNLVHLSFDQENILTGISSTSVSDPVVRVYARNQHKLMEQSQVIKDSLYALAVRSPQVGNVVNNELMAMELNLERSSELMGEGLYPQAGTNQQLVITAVNNLALFLSEILQSMEEQMANAKPGDENCEKGKSGGMGNLKSQSENMRKQLQKMIDNIKKGEGKNLNKEMSQSLMEHEMMQQMLRELMNNGSVGSDARKQLQQIDQLLEQNRREIMNKRLNQSIIQRHNEITSRLLEAEKSEIERDLDNKRESETADEEFYSNPAKLFEKNGQKNITLENFQRSGLKLTNFYQDKFKNYVEKFNTHGTQ